MAHDYTEQIREINALFEVEAPRRDANWRRSFFTKILSAPLLAPDPQIVRLPNNPLSYFAMSELPLSPGDHYIFTIEDVLDQCLERGLGIVINPQKETPDWVFHFGDLWDLRVIGNLDRFIDPPKYKPAPRTTETEVEFLTITDEVLPPVARRAFLTLLARLPAKAAAKTPKIAYMKDEAHPLFVLNYTEADFDSPSGVQALTNALSLLLRPGWGVAGADENSEVGAHMVPL